MGKTVGAVQGSGVQGSAHPPAKPTAGLIEKRNFKKQILDFGMRILDLRYSVYLKRLSEAILSFVIRHSNVVSHECGLRLKDRAVLIVKETFKKRISNIEQGIMNIEVRYSIDLKLSKIVRAKRFHTSSFDISCSIFCGSFLNFHIVS